MKILFCTNVFEVVENGPVKFANLILQINELYPEHEIRILTEDVTISRRNVHKVPLSERWKKSPLSQFVRMWVYHREAIRLCKDFPFDVLVYNNALVGLWSACRFGKTVGMINDDNNLTASWEQFRFSHSGIKRTLFHQIEKWMARKARTIIVNSDYLKEAVHKAYGTTPSKIHRLYKAVELAPVISASGPEIDLRKPIRVLFVKNDFHRGGLYTLMEALGQLPYQFILTIIGPASSELGYILSNLKKVSNVEGVLLGKVIQSKVMDELSKNHIFCVPSHKEGLGVANLEAMAHGIPVVSTNVGGIPEVLDEGTCGWMVPPGDAQALAHALEECILRPDIRKQKIEKALIQVRKFDTTTLFDTFLKILSR